MIETSITHIKDLAGMGQQDSNLGHSPRPRTNFSLQAEELPQQDIKLKGMSLFLEDGNFHEVSY
jgi:hypothetical protein